VASVINLPSASRRSPHQVGKAGSRHKNLHSKYLENQAAVAIGSELTVRAPMRSLVL
jgi:hypothetical protein